MKLSIRSWLLAACVAAGCSGGSGTQVLTGQVTTSGAIAVRAVSGNDVITAARVRSDGSFTLALPAGAAYRLELLTSNGVRQVLGQGRTALSFRVCHPKQAFDCGGMGGGDNGGGTGGGNGQGCDPKQDPNCGICDPDQDPNCPPPPPPPCDPLKDPNCPVCDPNQDPNCPPPPPPPCDPAQDPNGCCKTLPDGTQICPPPPCDPNVDPNCPTPPPPCTDPNDPTTCKDPCMLDPDACGCPPDPQNGGGTTGPGTNGSGTGGGDPGQCWPPPAPPQCDDAGKCDPNGVVPQHPPGDFGCEESGGS